nr:MAG TPA: hypothetical protein [Caudoviricetes sp.]
MCTFSFIIDIFLAYSLRRHPHDLVSPDVRYSLLTETIFPHSHSHIQKICFGCVFSSSSFITSNLPNF